MDGGYVLGGKVVKVAKVIIAKWQRTNY
jgi:molecular chaperone GrpE (heat shock protein)